MGTSDIENNISSDTEDHPHAYGDKYIDRFYYYYHQGSSPRVWGQEVKRAGFANAFRIIPTRMGTSREEISAVP